MRIAFVFFLARLNISSLHWGVLYVWVSWIVFVMASRFRCIVVLFHTFSCTGKAEEYLFYIGLCYFGLITLTQLRMHWDEPPGPWERVLSPMMQRS